MPNRNRKGSKNVGKKKAQRRQKSLYKRNDKKKPQSLLGE
jgi:hypothetical protein